jgi:hypothetical protein
MHQGANRFESRVSEHTRKYVSILNRFDESLNFQKKRYEIPRNAGIHTLIFINIHKMRCEIPIYRGNAAMDT